MSYREEVDVRAATVTSSVVGYAPEEDVFLVRFEGPLGLDLGTFALDPAEAFRLASDIAHVGEDRDAVAALHESAGVES